MRRWQKIGLSLVLSIFGLMLLPARSQASTPILPPHSQATGALILADTKYSTEGNADFEAKGTMIFGGYKAAINRRFAVGGGLGLLADGQTTGDIKAKSGTGYRLVFDLDVEATRFGANELIGGVGLVQDRFSYKQGEFKLDLTATDLALLILLRHQVGHLALHGGLQMYLSDSVDLRMKWNSNSASTSANRSDRINLRLGLAVAADPAVDLRLDLYLFGEQSIVIGADFKV